jgi:hypothetical protein
MIANPKDNFGKTKMQHFYDHLKTYLEKIIHRCEQGYVCSYSFCNYKSNSKSALGLHYIIAHDISIQYLEQAEVKLHMSGHFKEILLKDLIQNKPPFKCPIFNCQYETNKIVKWINHYGLFHGKVDELMEQQKLKDIAIRIASGKKGFLANFDKKSSFTKLFSTNKEQNMAKDKDDPDFHTPLALVEEAKMKSLESIINTIAISGS